MQVEHTVTEEVTGVDLVKTQLQLASGQTIRELGLDTLHHAKPRGFAIELRVNAESMAADASVRPANGTINVFEAPSGPGLRVDSYAYAGYSTNPRFDSLLAKLIAYSPSPHFAETVNKAYRALCKFRIEGVATNLGFLQALLQHPDFQANRIHTGFVEEKIAELTASVPSAHRRLYFERPSLSRAVGAKIDSSDPLAILDLGRSAALQVEQPTQEYAAQTLPNYDDVEGPENTVALRAPMQGTIVSVDANEGEVIAQGQQLIVMEAMKMEHVIAAPVSGILRRVIATKGDTVAEGQSLIFIEERQGDSAVTVTNSELNLDVIRPDLAEIIERHEIGLDAARPEAVARRRKTGQRTARENIVDLCDPDSFVEYGALGVAAQRRRRTMDDLIKNTPADGLITGHATINADLFGAERAHCVVLAYDFTVLAGTQGHLNHRKKDRMFQLARELRIPLVLFAEGGGGRPGDTDGDFSSRTFHDFPKLSGSGAAGRDCLGPLFCGERLIARMLRRSDCHQ